MKNHLRIQDNPKSCISWYFKTLFQTQIDWKYEVFHDMFALTSRIKSEAENRKPENWLLKHLTVSSVSDDFFQTE